MYVHRLKLLNNRIMVMCIEHEFGGLFEDPKRLERYQKLFAEAFPGQTALDVLNRKPKEDAEK